MEWDAVLTGQDWVFPTGAGAKPAICLTCWWGKNREETVLSSIGDVKWAWLGLTAACSLFLLAYFSGKKKFLSIWVIFVFLMLQDWVAVEGNIIIPPLPLLGPVFLLPCSCQYQHTRATWLENDLVSSDVFSGSLIWLTCGCSHDWVAWRSQWECAVPFVVLVWTNSESVLLVTSALQF